MLFLPGKHAFYPSFFIPTLKQLLKILYDFLSDIYKTKIQSLLISKVINTRKNINKVFFRKQWFLSLYNRWLWSTKFAQIVNIVMHFRMDCGAHLHSVASVAVNGSQAELLTVVTKEHRWVNAWAGSTHCSKGVQLHGASGAGNKTGSISVSIWTVTKAFLRPLIVGSIEITYVPSIGQVAQHLAALWLH